MAEGGYSQMEFYDVWAAINGRFDENATVTVVTFEYVGKVRP
jgi:hypothetical protein